MSPRTYLSIGDVLTLLRQEFPDVTISKIRFLESQGLVNPERSPSGYRKFYEHDVARLRWVLRQQREHFLPLKVIRDRLEQEGERAEGTEREGLVAVGAERGGAEAATGQDSARSEVARAEQQKTTTVRPDQARAEQARAQSPRSAAARHEAAGETSRGEAMATVSTLHAGGPGRSNGDAARALRRPNEQVASGPRGEEAERALEHHPAHPAAAVMSSQSAGAGSPGDGAGGSGQAEPDPAPEAGEVDPGAPLDPESVGVPSGGGGGDSHAPEAAPPGAPGAIESRSGGASPQLPPGATGASFTQEELCSAAGVAPDALAALERFGLVAPLVVAGISYYDEDALTVTRLAAQLAEFGVEPRHLTLYRNAVDREVGLVEQIITPLLRQRNPEARQRAVEASTELTRLGVSLRAALLRRELRRQLGT